MRVIAYAVGILVGVLSCGAEVMLVPRGSVWKYYYNGVVPTNWLQVGFDDHAWPSGLAQIGWGEGDEQTVAIDDPGYVPTLYFRKIFTVPDQSITTLTLRLVVDDGAVVYLNGVEARRRNMAAGTVNFLTPATVNVETNENTFVQFGIDPRLLDPGTNTISVELHQHPDGGFDASFDLELVANIPFAPPQITLLSPIDGVVVSDGNILIRTDATDTDGGVTRVAFLTNGVFLGESLAAPFSFLWEDPPAGRYTLVAQAFDDYNLPSDSQLVHIQVGQVTNAPNLERGPYLQMGSPTGMVVRWRTDWLTDSIVRYGTSASALTEAITNSILTAEHIVRVTGLRADTLYYYAVSSSEGTLAIGSEFRFRTSPTNERPIRIWAIGDSGTANQNPQAVRDAYAIATDRAETDVWLMLGDNAYDWGLEDEFQKAVFDVYPDLLRNTVLWPALGNHDAQQSTGGRAEAYLRAFSFPQNAEAGGVASGTPLYYSFDYGNSHFICLDSFLSDRSTNGPMIQWLRSDLAATEKDWIIAYWHHPPYSWGTHNSDEESFLIEMREHVLPVLEDYGVDLVLSGHSHVYERSFLLDGHYGYSWDFGPEMALDSNFGREDAAGPYRKPAGGVGSNRGTVYVVCGCSGEGGSPENFPRHPAMALNHGGFGSMVIEIDGLKLKASFLRPSGEIDDHFTIDKSKPLTNGPPLRIARGTNGSVLTWPTSRPAFELQLAQTLRLPEWRTTTNPVAVTGRGKQVSVEESQTNIFFRLRSVP